MPFLQHIEKLRGNRELVICDSELAMQVHKELIHLDKDIYFTLDKTTNVFDEISNIIGLCNSSSVSCISKIHLSLNWANLLQVSLWQTAMPTRGDVFILLRNAGITSQELQPFVSSDINDLLPYLYYGKRLDILRGVCHTAKRQMENHLNDHSIHVVCHLISDDLRKIVASSL